MLRIFSTAFILCLLIGVFTGNYAADSVTVSFQDGVAGYNGTRDTKLVSGNPTINFGTAAELELDGSPDLSSLLLWDLTSIPLGSEIQSVDITVNVTNSSSNGYEIYELKQPWVENQATWNIYASGQNWEVGGADGAVDRSSTVLGSVTSPARGFLTVSLNPAGIAVVQSWVDNPSSNYGFIILDYINASNGLDFTSREGSIAAERPKLTVAYIENTEPLLTINDVSVTEGDAGTIDATFTISLFPTSTEVVSVDYNTADGSASTADNDYVATTGQVIFQPGETAQPVMVTVNSDGVVEPNETFFVHLSNAINALIDDNQGVGTIWDDDTPPTPDIAVSPLSHDYGTVAISASSSQVFVVRNEGTANLNVFATLTGPDANDFSILSGGGSFVIMPAGMHNIDVGFMPNFEGIKSATLQLTSDDIDEDTVNVNLTGNATSLPGEPITFTVTGDYPYGDELDIVERHMNEHNLYSPSDFFVHVGDFFDQSDGCQEQFYQYVAAQLKTLAVPAFVVIGDNDWPDCVDPAQGFQWFVENFSNFEDNYCESLGVVRQSVRPENWAFVTKGVLYIGVNITGTSAGGGERDIRLQDNADWVDFHFQDKATLIRAAVVFGHAGPSSSESLFFDQFVTSSITLDKPVFYIHGHDHDWQLDNPFPAQNMQRLIVTRGGDEDPVQITVTMDTNNPFTFEREPWLNNPPLFNREPCVYAGSDKAVFQFETLNLNGVATDDGVPTNPGSLIVTWSKISGPGDVLFGNSNALITTADFTSAGLYELRLIADDGQFTTSDELMVDVSASLGITIDDVTVTEGNSGTVNANFTVSLSATSAQTVTVDYATANGTATAGSDYVAASDQLTFTPGQTSQPVTVVVNGDVLDEPNETFFVNLTNPVNATISDAQGTGTITDDDGAPTLSVDDVTVTEGNSGTVNANFTVSLSATSAQTVTVDYATANGTATAGSDYVAASDQLTFTPGQTSQPVTVVVNGDVLDEPNETFFVNLTNPVNATISDAQGTGTITDDDGAPTLSVDDVTVTEGNSGTVNANFTVSLSATSAQTVTVDYATANGTATAGSDYVAASDQLTFTPGQTSQPVTVVVNGDVLDEPNETFFVNLTNPVNATISDAQGTGTITDDDAAGGEPVTVSFRDGVNGYTGTRDTKLMSQTPTTNFGTAPEMELDGSPDRSSVLRWDLSSIPSGSFVQTVDITVNVTNSSGNSYEIYEMKRPWVETQATWNEYAGGQSWQTAGADGSGDRGSTVLGIVTAPAKGLLTISLNTAGVTIVQSWIDNPGSNQGFVILDYINASNGLDFSSRENGIITNHPMLTVTYSGSGEPPAPTLSIDDVTVTEGNSGTVNANFTVTLSAGSSQTVTVNYATANGTATAGSDYVAASDQLTFTPGQTSQPVTVVVNGDVLDEPNETFFVNLSNPVNATISDAQGTGTITDDDGAPTLSVDDVTVTEGNSGTVNANFTVSLSATSAQTVTVDYATANGTATAGSDYVSASDQLTFTPGQTSQPVTVVVNGDVVDEPNETFFVNLTNPVNATISDAQGTGTITDDDGAPTLSVDDVTVTEGNSGTVNANFTVSLSATSAQTVTVDYATANGTATAGSDYVAASDQLTFTPGQTSQPVTVVVNGDVLDEPNETFFVNLTNPVNATISDAQGTGTITDDDGAPTLSVDDVTVTEGNSGTVNANFTVSLSATSAQTVTVDYATANGTATAGSDYVAASDQLTFTPGQTSQPVTVVVNGDVVDEPNETFFVNLTNPVNATISDAQGTGTITDDDGAPTLSVDDVTVTEGNSGTVNANFTVSLSATSAQTVTVDYATANGTATAGSDYVAASDQLTFTPGQTSQPVTVVVNGDVLDEPNETFFVNLTNPVNATISDAQGTGTITDDDAAGGEPVTVSFRDGVNGYTGTRDTKLMSQTPTTNFGTAPEMELDGSPDRSSVLRWDLSSIPSGSFVQTVDITVNVTNSSGNSYEIYEMKRPWVETQATWNEYAGGQSWQTAGADGSGDRGSTVLGIVTAPAKGLLTISLNTAGVTIVQSWIDNPGSNQGFVILDYINASNGLDFSSREASTVAERPELAVTYIVPSGTSSNLALLSKSLNPSELPSVLPETVALQTGYPNPFNLETHIAYALPEPSHVRLTVYNVRGQVVRKLVDEIQPAGFKKVLWNGRNDFGREVVSGIYFIQLLVEHNRFVSKILLQK